MKKEAHRIKFILFVFTFFAFALLLIIPLAYAQLSNDTETSSDEPAKFFISKCSSCHTVGDGELTGPDLIDATTFPYKDLFAAIKRMEDKVGPMEESDIKGQTDFLKSKDVKERIKGELERLSKTKLKPADAELGEKLFFGEVSFENKGSSCISCHHTRSSSWFSGGNLGPSLGSVMDRFTKRTLVSAISNSNWKIMRNVYKDHPVTKQEALHIAAYLDSVKDGPRNKSNALFHVIGLVGCFVLFGIVAFVYRNRLTSVRKRIRRN